MTISSKLATDFVKRNFGAFRFESQPCWNRLTAYHLRQAYVTVGCADLHLFALDTGSTSCMMMSMPKCLKPTTSTLDEMLSKIERDNMDMSDYLEATAFECLIGFLYQTGQYGRILELIGDELTRETL